MADMVKPLILKVTLSNSAEFFALGKVQLKMAVAEDF